MYSIYEIKNKENGKVYIGYTKDPKRRWRSHVYLLRKNIHHCQHLQNAWNLYGKDSFEFIIIELDKYDTISEASSEEAAIIEKYRQEDLIYNTNKGGTGFHGVPWNKGKTGIYSEETIEKIKKARAKQDMSVQIEAMKAANIGKLSKLKGVPLKPAHSKKIKESLSTLEVRERMRESHKGKVSNMKGKKHSEESKEKMRQAAIRNNSRPPVYRGKGK